MDRIDGDAALSAYAEPYGLVERELFAEAAAGRSAASLKSGYLKRYGIPARMFNGVRVLLEGKVASVREQQKLRLDSLSWQIDRGQKADCRSGAAGREGSGHHKRRRLTNLQHRLAALETDVSAGKTRLCFGSKRLWWHRQHNLKANGYGWRFCRRRLLDRLVLVRGAVAAPKRPALHRLLHAAHPQRRHRLDDLPTLATPTGYSAASINLAGFCSPGNDLQARRQEASSPSGNTVADDADGGPALSPAGIR